MQVIKKLIISDEYEIAKNILYTILNRLNVILVPLFCSMCNFGLLF